MKRYLVGGKGGRGGGGGTRRFFTYMYVMLLIADITSPISISPRDRRVLQASHRLNQITLVPRCHSSHTLVSPQRVASISASSHSLAPRRLISPSSSHQPFLARCVFPRPLARRSSPPLVSLQVASRCTGKVTTLRSSQGLVFLHQTSLPSHAPSSAPMHLRSVQPRSLPGR